MPQNEMKQAMGQVELTTTQYMLQVTYQLLTTIMWNSVTNEDPKSLKFIKQYRAGVIPSVTCADSLVI